ncbi:hypothetical protein COCMIDRAFT_32495 [Bipolaris oryzae ATCC 44560]|uniref:RNase III domain-containing protein n=1 Tax=Bipolaris oryzae ATCC 44560 TaxID=930090 RepID=W7A2D5_COCMI|nr:uncharacterized protein COCMIDRAFT_32495 [Bipolaris oryzae ATCC 44560]EUC50161.1 hypothetical protein COCMIDRAFT_32495 [Bipolaris oryzae ATCC 44560]
MIFKGSRPSVPLRRCLPYRLPDCSYSTPWHLQGFHNKRQVKSAPDCSSTQRRLLWGSSEPPQHFGPKSRMPDLFERKDEMCLRLATQQLEWHGLPPSEHHDMLEAVARVGRIEGCIQYTFRNKMLCVEALKVTSSNYPLFFKGMIHKVKRNNRLALLGDRVLSMVLCEIWYSTGNSPDTKINDAIATSSALYERARKLRIDREILIGEGMYIPSIRHIAESLEAILGAVYVDSDHNLETVKQVIKYVELDKHESLKAQPEAHLDQADGEKQHMVFREEELPFEERIRSLEHEAEVLQKDLWDAESSITGVSGAKPNISPEAQVAIRREAAKLSINARQLWKEIGQVPASVACSSVKIHIKRRARAMIQTAVALQSGVGHSDGTVEEQSTEEPAIGATTTDEFGSIVLSKNENLPPDEPVEDGTPETTEKQPDSLTCLFPNENSTDCTPKLAISASQKSPVIPAYSVLPKDSNITIIALIAELNEILRQHDTQKMSGIGMPSDRELCLKFVAWKNALNKTNSRERRGKSTNTLAVYEEMLQKSLRRRVIKERKCLAGFQKKVLVRKIRRVESLEVEKPTASTPAKEEINLAKEQDQNQGQGQKQEKKRLAPAHHRHQKEIGDFLESVKHPEQTEESIEDIERTISDMHAAAWETTNKTAEQAPQRVSLKPSHSPSMGPGIHSINPPERMWSIQKPGKTSIRFRPYPSPYKSTSRDRAGW